MKMLWIAVGVTALAVGAWSRPSRVAVSGNSYSMFADTSCPAENANTRRRVMKFLTSSGGFADDRSDLGLTVSDTATVRLLVDSTDTAACRWFAEQVTLPAEPALTWAFYQVRGFYFVVTAKVPVDSSTSRDFRSPEYTPFAIFDSTFALRKTIGM